MNKHLLVTASGDRSALMGLKFVNGFFEAKAGVRVTVFYTTPKPPAVWEGELNHATLDEYETRKRANEVKGRNILDDALRLLIDGGFPAENVDAKMILRSISKAEDILREGEEGLYDALVLGRRGVTRLEQLVEESVSGQLALRNAACPLWVCRSPEPGRSGVLLCLDGSDASMRTADHVGWMVAGEPRHEVTMLRVHRGGGLGEPAESMFQHAKSILMENGVDDERIREMIVDNGPAAKAIMDEAQRGKYAAVAIGRTGRGRSLLRRLFMGSVGRALLHELEGAVLWMRS